jgi:aspartyl protease family protein
MLRTIIAILAVAAGILAIYWLASGDTEGSNISGGMVAAVLSSAGFLVLIGSSAIRQYRGQASQALTHLAMWLAIIVTLVGGYAYRFEMQSFGHRVLGAIVPGTAVNTGDGQVVITRQGDDSFVLAGEVNGERARFIFDTGADMVVLTAQTAEKLSLRLAPADFSVTVQTANGATQAAPTRLREVRIGAIAIQNVDALVAAPGALQTNLLGMSFLSRLKHYGVSGDRLTLEAN